ESVCKDLERRCEQVEAPLRDDEARAVEAQTEMRSLHAKVQSLEQELPEERVKSARLAEELITLTADNAHALQYGHDTHQQLCKAQEELEAAKVERDESVH